MINSIILSITENICGETHSRNPHDILLGLEAQATVISFEIGFITELI